MTQQETIIVNGNIDVPLPKIKGQLSHHYESLFLMSKEAFSRKEYELTIILCSCACEMLMERTFRLMFGYSKMELLYDTVIEIQCEYNNITKKRNRDLYTLLSKDNISETFKDWSNLCKHYKKRHEVAHRGITVSQDEAATSLKVVKSFIEHIENQIEKLNTEKPLISNNKLLHSDQTNSAGPVSKTLEREK